jgi:hypothetical protein
MSETYEDRVETLRLLLVDQGSSRVSWLSGELGWGANEVRAKLMQLRKAGRASYDCETREWSAVQEQRR